MDFFQNTYFKERSNMAVKPNLWVTISWYKKECLPFITRNKKHSLKEVASMIYTLGKDFLQLGLFKVREMFLFRQSKEVGSILWSVSVFFAFVWVYEFIVWVFFAREDRTKQIVFMKRKFSFPCVDIYSNVPKGKYILKSKLDC